MYMRERVLILLLITHTGGRELSTDDVDLKTVYWAFNRSFYTRSNIRDL